MPLIFCNIGWMNKYNGISGDSIERGGKYNKHSIGHEVCNFTNNRGTVYGYVQPVGDSIKIEKLGASKKDESIDGVTVVWAAGPESGGTARTQRRTQRGQVFHYHIHPAIIYPWRAL